MVYSSVFAVPFTVSGSTLAWFGVEIVEQSRVALVQLSPACVGLIRGSAYFGNDRISRNSRDKLADLLQQRGKLDEAESLLRENLETCLALRALSPDHSSHRVWGGGDLSPSLSHADQGPHV